MKLRLELEVEYEDAEDPGLELLVNCREDDAPLLALTRRQDLDAQLLAVATHAAANGLLTGDLPVVVSDWEARVVAL